MDNKDANMSSRLALGRFPTVTTNAAEWSHPVALERTHIGDREDDDGAEPLFGTRIKETLEALRGN